MVYKPRKSENLLITALIMVNNLQPLTSRGRLHLYFYGLLLNVVMHNTRWSV